MIKEEDSCKKSQLLPFSKINFKYAGVVMELSNKEKKIKSIKLLDNSSYSGNKKLHVRFVQNVVKKYNNRQRVGT